MSPYNSSLADKPLPAATVPRIDVTEPHSVKEWSIRLGCSPNLLRDAIASVGNVVGDVERHFHPPRDDKPHRAALVAAFE
ncbi:MAG: DUF3606 domain-containing protein [Granulicella sp.]